MATASVTNTFVAGTDALASEVNTNFSELVSFLNANVVHVDGSKSMTGALDMGSNKVTNVSTPTATGDAANKSYVDGLTISGTYTPTLGNITLGSGGTNTAGYDYVKTGTSSGVLTLSGVVALGTSGAVSGTASVTIPSGYELSVGATINWVFPSVVKYSTGGTGGSIGIVRRDSSDATKLVFYVFDASTTYVTSTAVTTGVPLTWASGSTIYWQAHVQVNEV